MRRPPLHHVGDGTFHNPWLEESGWEERSGGFWRWQWERLTEHRAPNPAPEDLPSASPRIARPAAPRNEIRITWVGHATFLLQIGGLNLLTDPHWSRRASPLQWLGPARFVPPGVSWDEVPRIDAVLLSHDHYDHLDDPTVRRLARRFREDLRWITPLGYAGCLEERGAGAVTELDWWEETRIDFGDAGVRITCVPAQHWTRRTPWKQNRRLWSAWIVEAPDGRRIFFGGDSGYFPGFQEIGERLGPFTAALLPIGAYEPRWFMRPSHMNPEEAVRAYRDLGGEGIMVGMHWGTFRLTDEDPLEPPVRTRAAWRDAGLPEERLRIPRHGETVVLGGNTAMRRPGGWEGKVWMADDFDGPLPPEIQRGFAGENPDAAES
ncbi:hypothetical protein BH20GEM2_BH20GEM2_20150 [soil metagenome]